MNNKIHKLYNKANQYKTTNENEKAIEYYKKVLELDKNNKQTLKEIGEVYERINDNMNAINSYKNLLDITPNTDIPTTVIYLNQIGMCYNKLREYNKSLGYFKQILKIKNDIPDVYNNIYSCYCSLNQYKLAEITLLLSFKIKSNEQTIKNLAFLYNCLKDYDKSITYYNMLSNIDTKLKYDMSFVYLAKKNFKYGYELYENRLKNNNISPLTGEKERAEIPFISYWDGISECHNLLIVYEQGIGDNIQYFRFIIELSQLYPNMKITYFCKDIISHIFKEYENIQIVKNIDNILLYNYKIYIMSLPYLLKKETITPNIENYININEEKLIYWKNQLEICNPQNKLNVGFFYKGLLNFHIEKNIPLENFKTLTEHNINLICLHKTKEIENDLNSISFKDKLTIFDIDKDVSFIDTIAILKNIDILITIDSSITHLAGVLNVKTLLLLGYISEWRWFNDNSKIWYNSVDLLHMTKNIELKNIIPQVKDILSNMIASK